MNDIEEYEGLSEFKKQIKHLKYLISYLKRTELNDLCLKPSRIEESYEFEWIKTIDFKSINELSKKIKEITIKHLENELKEIEEKFKIKMKRLIFIEI